MKVRTYSSAHINGRPVQLPPIVVVTIVSGIFLLVGAMLAIMGLAFSRSSAKLKERCTVPVEAYVVQFQYNDEGLASPVYEYAYNGITHSFSNNSYSNAPIYGVGEKAELMINPDKPQEAYVPADKTFDFVGRILTIVGFSAAGIAVLVMIIFFAVVHTAGKQVQKKEEPWEM